MSRKATDTLLAGDVALSVGDSGMPSPPGWKWTPLQSVARLESGHTPSREHADYWNGEVPWVGIRDAREHHGRTILTTLQSITEKGLANSAARWLPAKTVCLSRTASVGYVTVLGRTMATSQDFVNWICGGALEPEFLKNLFIAEKESLLRFAKGSVHKTVYFPEVQAFHVCLPPVAEQRRIVAKLEDLLARSRRAKEALDAIPPLLESLRRSILAAAFRGDLTAEWREKHPDVESADRLLARIRVERRKQWEAAELARMRAKGKAPTDDRWKEKYQEPEPVDASELPELPEGWAWGRVDAAGEVVLGRRRAADEYVDGVDGRRLRRYVRVANVKEDRLDLSDVNEMPFSDQELALYRLEVGDIILSEGQSPELVGQSAVFRGGMDDLCIQATVHRFRANPSIVDGEFAQLVFLHCLKSGVFQRASSLTVNIAHLTSEKLRPLPFPVPPLEEQREAVRRARALLGSVAIARQVMKDSAARLHQLDRSTLSKAFRGELVPQDPDDEPAEVLLARLKAATAVAEQAGAKKIAKRRAARA
jgi:type I restriction enzyme S subunit